VNVRARLVLLATVLVPVAGVVSVVSGVVPPAWSRLRVVADVLGLPVADGSTAAVVVLGVGAVLLALPLRRRRRWAWRLAIVLLALMAAFHLAKGLDVEEAAVCVIALAVLLAARRSFTTEPSHDDGPRPLLLFAGLLPAACVLGWAVVVVNVRGYRPSAHAVLVTTLKGLVGLRGLVTFPTDRATDVVAATLLALGILTALLPLVAALLRSSTGPGGLTAVETLRLQRIGGSPELGQRFRIVFAPSGSAAIDYRVSGSVALCVGEPLGRHAEWDEAVAAFHDLAARRGWTPGVVTTSDGSKDVWAQAGLPLEPLPDLPAGLIGPGPAAQLRAWWWGVRLWRRSAQGPDGSRPVMTWIGVERASDLPRVLAAAARGGTLWHAPPAPSVGDDDNDRDQALSGHDRRPVAPSGSAAAGDRPDPRVR
jgi:lysyl-tRNA synthetase class 2